MKSLIAVAAAAIVCCSANAADAQTQLVANPSFENGLTGWTQVNSGACVFDARATGSVQPGSGSPTGPADGANYANIGPFGGLQTCFLYQDIAIPVGSTTQLTFAAAAGFDSGATTTEYTTRFEVVSPSTNAVLATPYARNGAQGSQLTFANQSLDLTPFAGQTVRLRAVFTNGSQCCNDAFIDNVRAIATPTIAAIPTMSEWAMIFFGIVLAGGAALFVQSRRATI